ncbi:Zn(II)2Cys6 transcription factor domain-containing protein [Aspergillus stella-maris]|uniref:Zn(II)2Cys6 transcription factor domain-containing protein n=1 Tax=Aspergillus stella-maris TaxID=1810926 RepID=UPI003CCD3804
MSHRQSCDRCRQQKVRCIRDEAQSQAHAQRGSSYPDHAPLTSCERCLKAGADCVYSLKQRSTRHAAQPSLHRSNNPSHDHTWFDQGLNVTDFNKPISTPFPGLESVNPWDASLQSLLTPSTFFNPLSAASDLAPVTIQPENYFPQSTTRSQPESSDSLIDEYDDDDDDDDNDNDTDNDRATSTSLFSQLTSLSKRTRKAKRRLTRPDQIPLTVSSPEVNEALESTNALLRIMNNIAAPITQCDITLDTNRSTSDQGLAFLALACHQQLVALFRAICDAVRRWLQHRDDECRNRQRSNSGSSSSCSSDIGPSSVAQFIMVLQLLIHLINRMDRSLPASRVQNQHNPSLMWPSEEDISSSSSHSHCDPLLPETIASGSPTPGGLLVLVKDIVGTIPHEHENLRQIIQKLQTEMEHLDFQ